MSPYWCLNLSSITVVVSRSTYYVVFKYSLGDVRWGPYNPGIAGHPSPVTCKEFIEEEGLLRVKGSFASCRREAQNGNEGWQPVEREERSDSSGTISSRSHRTSCHPRPYISWLVLRPSQGPAAPSTSLSFAHPLPSRSARYTEVLRPSTWQIEHTRPLRKTEQCYERYMWTIRQTNGSLSLSDPPVLYVFSSFFARHPFHRGSTIASRATRRSTIRVTKLKTFSTRNVKRFFTWKIKWRICMWKDGDDYYYEGY